MKMMKKLSALALAIVMMLAMTVTAFASNVPSNVDSDGKGTITINNAYKGETYTIYKIFDASVHVDGDASKSIVYTRENYGGSKYFSVDANGYITATAEAGIGGKLTEGAIEELKSLKGNPAKAPIKADSNTVVFSGLDYGYYLVESTTGDDSQVAIDSTNPSADIHDKNTTKPSIPGAGPNGGNLKTVSNAVITGDSNATTTTAKIGDTVCFRIQFTATNYFVENKEQKLINEYTITDTPVGLKIDGNSVEVTLAKDGVAVEKPADPVTKNVTDAGMSIVIPWADANGNSYYNNETTVTVTYSAEVISVDDAGQATNSAKVEFGGTPLTGTTTVNTYKLTVNKVNNENVQLSGAEFDLYDTAEGGNLIAVVDEGNGVYHVANTAEKTAQGFVSAKIVAGNVVINGLKGGEKYYLEETKAPAGYNMLAVRKEIEMSHEGSNADVTSKVINEIGSTLPSTGGIGTTIFYVVGGILVAAAVVLLVTKKRMSNRA